MSVTYEPIHWTTHKKRYDRILLGLVFGYLSVFIGLQAWIYPQSTFETNTIRATGTLAFFLLHLTLCIGPLCRLDRRLLPLLYNRRHLGVTVFLLGGVHGVFSLLQFHSQGNAGLFVSLFSTNTAYHSFAGFPFQVLGFFALVILFLMAATSHDFWLHNLTPRVWKRLHMLVYLAYALLLMHVMLGVVQLEKSPALIGLTGIGLFSVVGLHVTAALRQMRLDRLAERPAGKPEDEGFVYACQVTEIPNNCAKMLMINDQNIALFKYGNKLSAVHNLCRHQNGPLSEGRIIDGCITCPWHGYQYLPGNGQSPPPFRERLNTYDVLLRGQSVYVHPKPYPEGTERPPAIIPAAPDDDNLFI
ncbi:MAG: ferric reductase-like transmembrane domain-containing protein [Saprospiraceae bacterium]|nr:ferric reductase-like transmembrane domain-containing protein [Saprospiraceae bacterium]